MENSVFTISRKLELVLKRREYVLVNLGAC